MRELSPEQLEVLSVALDHGYLQEPAQATIEAMADDADMSSSTFAARLHAAEQRIAEQLDRSQ